jgi:tudor domain-containing protein 3
MLQSLDANRDKENKENTEFEAQRKDAIAEAARGGAKKVFGGGNKPVSVLHNTCTKYFRNGYKICS